MSRTEPLAMPMTDQKTDLTPEQRAVVDRVGYADLAVLARLDLQAVLADRGRATLRALFRVSKGARTMRARAIRRDAEARRNGNTSGSTTRDQFLDRLVAIYGEDLPSWNTIARECIDIL